MDRNVARQLTRAQLDRIGRVAQAGEHRRLKQLCREHFAAPIVRLDAAYRTLDGSPSYEDANQLSGRINLFRRCGAPVRWWREPKRRAGFRVVCSLPRELHAANLIIRDVLQAQFRPGDHLYDVKGRGRDREALAIQAALEQGFRYVFQGDLRNAFSSVQVETLYDLPLPARVIRYALDYRSMNFRHLPERERKQGFASTREALLSEAIYGEMLPGRCGPRGLLQGSPASNLVLAWLLNELPSVLPPGCVPFLLADNVLVAARTEQECRAIEQTLIRFFAEHRAGPFVLGSREISSIEKSFERAGYEFELTDSGRVRIAPDGYNCHRMFSAFFDAIQVDAAAGRLVPGESLRVLSRKLSGFRVMTDRAQFWAWNVEHMLGELAEAAWNRDEGG